MIEAQEAAIRSGEARDGDPGAAFVAAINVLRDAQRQHPCAAIEQALIDLRVRGFAVSNWPEPRPARQPVPPPVANGELHEIHADELSCARLQDAVMAGGGLLVRGLMPAALTASMRTHIDLALQARCDAEKHVELGERTRWYSRSGAVQGGPQQFWAKPNTAANADFGSLWAADCPAAAECMASFYRSRQLPRILDEYFGETAVQSVKKWVLRKATPKTHSGWHQDGRFMGDDIRSVNLWIALSPCGGSSAAPGMEILADHRKRIHPTGTDGAMFDWVVGPELVARLAEETPVLTPEFQPGDALFFDHFNLHRTQCRPTQTDYRYAVEAWFFAASSAPAKQMPMLL